MKKEKLIEYYTHKLRYCLHHFHDALHHDYIRHAVSDLRAVKNGRDW